MSDRLFDLFLVDHAGDKAAQEHTKEIALALSNDGLGHELEVLVDDSLDSNSEEALASLAESIGESKCVFIVVGELGLSSHNFTPAITRELASNDLFAATVLLPGSSGIPALPEGAPRYVIDLTGQIDASGLTPEGEEELRNLVDLGSRRAVSGLAPDGREPAPSKAVAATTPTVPSATPNIFISYRREDSEGHTGRLYDELARRFGDENVFMDIDNIPLGVDFTRVVDEAVRKCDVLIAVIGRYWLTVADSSGSRRLDNPEDFVRLEIKTALDRDVHVIPAFVQNAEMPERDQLPDDLAGLSRMNGISLRADSWHTGVERLMREIEQAARQQHRASEDARAASARRTEPHASIPLRAKSPTEVAPGRRSAAEQDHVQIDEQVPDAQQRPPMRDAEVSSIDVSPTELDFGLLNRDSPCPAQTILIKSTGQDVDPVASSDASWITLEQEANVVSVSIDTTTEGTFFGYVVVRSTAGDRFIPVRAVVDRGPVLDVVPTTVDFGRTTQGEDDQATIRIANGGSGELKWRFRRKGDFFTVKRASGGLTLTLADQPGKYSGSITIKSNGGDSVVEVLAQITPKRKKAPKKVNRPAQPTASQPATSTHQAEVKAETPQPARTSRPAVGISQHLARLLALTEDEELAWSCDASGFNAPGRFGVPPTDQEVRGLGVTSVRVTNKRLLLEQKLFPSVRTPPVSIPLSAIRDVGYSDRSYRTWVVKRHESGCVSLALATPAEAALKVGPATGSLLTRTEGSPFDLLRRNQANIYTGSLRQAETIQNQIAAHLTH